MAIPGTLTTQINAWLSKKWSSLSWKWIALAGDGSTRTFYRVTDDRVSCVVLHDPTWTLSQDYFVLQQFLKSRGIPTPEFFFEDPKTGVLIMEDVGDDLLQSVVFKSPDTKLAWMHLAIELLVKLQTQTFPVPKHLPVSNRSFDQQKFSEEFFFTFEHLGTQLLGLGSVTPSQREGVLALSHQLASIKPLVFAHRDYHTRNLLVRFQQLYVIDFQDARLGSPHYDIASLLLDPYVALSVDEISRLKRSYISAIQKTVLGHEIDWTHFDRNFSLIGFQRLVKAAGSFASFFTRFGKKTHLPYLVPALTSALALIPEPFESAFPIPAWIKGVQSR